MSDCKRFEEEALSKIEQGVELDEHFANCEDCIAARNQYDRLTGLVKRLHADARPGTGWTEAVATASAGTARSRGRNYYPGILALAASVTIFAVAIGVLDRKSAAPDLQIEINENGAIYRGDAARPGDTITISTTTSPNSENVELRLYRADGRLVFACTDEPPCQRTLNQLTASAVLATSGTYRAVVLESSSEIPGPTPSLDQDVLLAREQGATVVVSGEIAVR